MQMKFCSSNDILTDAYEQMRHAASNRPVTETAALAGELTHPSNMI